MRQKGFTLIEVMIALVVLATGLLALMTMQIVSIRSNAFSSEMTYASMLAQSRLEELRNMTYDTIQTIPDEIIPADATAMGISYIVQRIVSNDGIPGPGMKTVTLTINWKGAPAGSATAQNTIQFTTSFTTVITR